MGQAKTQDLTLDTIAGGAIPEQFQAELVEVVKNILDPNTAAKAKRTITVKIVFSPTEQRDAAGVTAEVTKKLAPKSAVGDLAYMGRRGDQVVATRFDPGQRRLPLDGEAPDDESVVPIGNSERRAQ